MADDTDAIEKQLRALIGKINGRDKVVPATRLYHDLRIWGDDAFELLEEIHRAFGTRFDTFDVNAYFPYENEAGPFWLEKLLRLKDDKRILTFGHLLDVVKEGEWFEPNAFDLSQVVVLNESPHEQSRGDVSLFATIESARLYLEPIDVVNRSFFGYLADGTRLCLSVAGGEIDISPFPGTDRESARVRRLMEETASFVSKRPDVDAAGDLSKLPTEDLVKLIGFTR